MQVDDQLARRIRAAIALAGLTGVPDLAKHLPAGLRLGQDTIYERLAGKSELRDHEYDAIVAVCSERGVPPGFFTADLSRLVEEAEQPSLERRVAALEELIRETVVPALPTPGEDPGEAPISAPDVQHPASDERSGAQGQNQGPQVR